MKKVAPLIIGMILLVVMTSGMAACAISPPGFQQTQVFMLDGRLEKVEWKYQPSSGYEYDYRIKYLSSGEKWLIRLDNEGKLDVAFLTFSESKSGSPGIEINIFRYIPETIPLPRGGGVYKGYHGNVRFTVDDDKTTVVALSAETLASVMRRVQFVLHQLKLQSLKGE